MGGRGEDGGGGGGVYVRVWVGSELQRLQDLVNRSVWGEGGWGRGVCESVGGE